MTASGPRAPLAGTAKSVALYGNSYTHYNNSISTRLRDLAAGLLPDGAAGYRYRSLTISGGLLGWHEANLALQSRLVPWDVAVFQGNSTEPVDEKPESREYFTESAGRMAAAAQQAGTQVLYFMTWAPKDAPDQTVRLAEAYLEIAGKTGGTVAPVGLAFARAQQAAVAPDLYFVDGKHPSLAGTYLAACVFFAVLYNRSPLGGAPATGSDMTPADAATLQQIAWQTVCDFRTGS
ncbi:hypothetical protein [Radicibacter daui]|uniref:hypothetical protein n=1 Tax=Radicibacter daui TaxID=3064829 RepID=UPI004046D815